VLRTFAIAMAGGAVAALVLLGSVDLVDVPHFEPRLEPDVSGATLERWVIEPADRLAVTGTGVQPRPAGISPLTDPVLEGVAVATMKVRDSGGTVIGVASRIVARELEGAPPAAWWSFVMGERGTLAAQLPSATEPAGGRLLGGTRTFAGVAGRFVEHTRADGGYELQVWRDPAGAP
jgi:hypothetical protein